MLSLVTDFRRGLLAGQPAPCLSLYQPTHQHHPDNQQDPIRFRNLVRALDRSLRLEYHPADARALLEPFEAVASDTHFWNGTQRGLAVLGAPDFFRVYHLRRSVPERVVVADSFHVKPLLRIVQSADPYHVLALSRQQMRLFEGNRDTLGEIDLVPGARTLTEALGDHRTEPHLTVAWYGAAGGGLAQRHGHGSRKDEVDIDAERFFRAVDRSILENYSQPSGLPLILAALTEHHATFRHVSQNPSLVSEAIQVDPRAMALHDLASGHGKWLNRSTSNA